MRGELCFPCGSNSCFPGGWTRNTWRLEELRELPYPATSTSLTWLVSEAMSPLGCEGQGQDSWDLALPSPCAAELGLLLEPNSPAGFI